MLSEVQDEKEKNADIPQTNYDIPRSDRASLHPSNVYDNHTSTNTNNDSHCSSDDSQFCCKFSHAQLSLTNLHTKHRGLLSGYVNKNIIRNTHGTS